MKTHVYAGGDLVAEQQFYDGGVQALVWQQRNPVTGTKLEQQQRNGWMYQNLPTHAES